MDTRSARSRAVAAIVASLALLGSGAAITSAPAQSAPPEQDCADAFPVASITQGMPVDGLTVTEGTEPTEFAGEVIGVLKDGIAPGIDMIIADLGNQTGDPAHDTRIDQVGGIWQGMSGSPVYTDGGELLGAVAYGLSWGPSTVAGITPYEQMDDYLPGRVETEVSVPDGMARAIAAGSDVSARQAGDGLEQLRVPLTINGISQSRLKHVRSGTQGRYLHRQGRAGTLVGGAGPGVMADESDVVDGGNLGAAISYGTITAGGVGTVTDRCGDDLVGFGHPMMFSGATSLGVMPADALYVQEESLGAPFKVANLAAPVGTITQDRLTGITGTVAGLPAEVPIVSTVSYGERSRTGESKSLSQEWNTDVTLMQVLAMHDVAIDAIQPGSETSGVTVTVTAGGEEIPITSTDRYVSDYDIAYAGLWSIGDLVHTISRLDGVEITGVTTDSDVTDSTDISRLGKMQQKRGRHMGRRRPPPAGSRRAGWPADGPGRAEEPERHRVGDPAGAGACQGTRRGPDLHDRRILDRERRALGGQHPRGGPAGRGRRRAQRRGRDPAELLVAPQRDRQAGGQRAAGPGRRGPPLGVRGRPPLSPRHPSTQYLSFGVRRPSEPLRPGPGAAANRGAGTGRRASRPSCRGTASPPALSAPAGTRGRRTARTALAGWPP